MYVKQIYTNCLSQASYYIESNRDAIIIDPIRDSALYMNLIKDQLLLLKKLYTIVDGRL